MQINSFCEVNYSNDCLFSAEQIEHFSNEFARFVLSNNLTKDFSSEVDYGIEIMVCDNNFIHNINRDYRGKDCPTDVITFALYYDSEEKLIIDNNISLGQILISYDKVISQAEENNVTCEYEFLNLLAHGILHLFGFDHLDDESLEYMLDLQEKMIVSVKNVKV